MNGAVRTRTSLKKHNELKIEEKIGNQSQSDGKTQRFVSMAPVVRSEARNDGRGTGFEHQEVLPEI